jgi:hypothetical protein
VKTIVRAKSGKHQGTRRDPDAYTKGRWLESYNVYSSKGVGKRMVGDRHKVKTRSESRRYRVADGLVVKAGRMVRQVGTMSRNRQGSKPGGLE